MLSASLLVGAIFAPALAGLLGMALPRGALGARVGVAVLGPVLSLAGLSAYVAMAGLDAAPVGWQWMPALRLDMMLHADRLGLFFAFLVSGVGLLITLYSRAYFGPDAASLFRFYPSLHLFMTAMVGVALADNFMLLLLFWELTSISSFLLIGWDRDDPQAVRNAMQAFVVTAAGGLAMMGGLILLGVISETWSFSELAERDLGQLPAGRLIAAFILIFIGAAAKSAQWPWHFWLPGAMAAPTPVSAYLHSATMVKAGVYLIGRMWPILAVALPLWPGLIVPIGAFTMLLGAYVALRKSDLKQIFAYTTVSQLGLLMCVYGLGAFTYNDEPNVIWDITQIANHAMYKAPLFIIAGAIAHVAHTRELHELRGFFHRGAISRLMAALLLLAAYAMAAGPFTVSFTAKEFFFYAIDHGWKATRSPWFLALVAAGVATGTLNVAIFIRLARVLLGRGHGNGHDQAREHHGHAADHPEHESGMWPAFLWIPAAVLVLPQYIGGIVPGAYEAMLGAIERSRFYHAHFPLTWQAHAGLPLYMSLAAFALGVVLGFAPVLRGVIRDAHDRLYPAFYNLCTEGGGRLFRLVQTGNFVTYGAVAAFAMIGLALWGAGFRPLAYLNTGAALRVEGFGDLLPAYLLAFLVCLGSVLMPIVKERASRVLVLGTVGFSVTTIYYLYYAPDLALTQLSIEIVSLILFLLVLGLLPRTAERVKVRPLARTVLAVTVGLVMFWLTLGAASGQRPGLTRWGGEGTFSSLGEFFLRNSDHGQDTSHMPADRTVPGTVVRGRNDDGTLKIHSGGGGSNVVNVILVDFRGFDTLGEITVLGLAALGVWTLLRRRRPRTSAGRHQPGRGAAVAAATPAHHHEGSVPP